MTNPLIGLRLRAMREERKINQSRVAELLGLADHQSVSNIENGERRAKADELGILIDHFGLDPDYFTDPFRLVGEGRFSWRQTACSQEALEAYQASAGRWLAAYRSLSDTEDRPGPPERRSLRLWAHSTYEQAQAEGERIVRDYEMGDVPALELPRVMENDFGILVLMVDMDEGISGAACRLPELDAILVNRRENKGRRNFDLAHEFFHILTWDAMPPKLKETATEKGGDRVEQLANAFARGLLMPHRLLARFGEWRRLGDAERVARMREAANHFHVSVSALFWRLVSLGLLSAEAKRGEAAPATTKTVDPLPPLFSKVFVTTIANAIEKGRLSVGKTVKILGQSREQLREIFASHGVPVPVTV